MMKNGQFTKNLSPARDFYSWVNQDWITTAHLPLDQTRWGPLEEIAERNMRILKDILHELPLLENPTSEALQVLNFFSSAMDIKSIEKADISPISDILTQIQGIHSIEELFHVIIVLQRTGSNPLFKISALSDPQKNSKVIPHLQHRGLGLIDREFYLDSVHTPLREKYRKYLKLILSQLKLSPLKANIVLDIEKQLALVSLYRLQKDPRTLYQKYSFTNLKNDLKNIPWKMYFEQLKVASFQELVVDNFAYFKCLNSLLELVPMDHWRTFFTCHAVLHFSPVLSQPFANAHEDFNSRAIKGQKKLKTREKRMLELTNSLLGMPLGKLFIQKTFSEKSKRLVSSMAKELKKTFRKKISSLAWLEESTKTEALQKIDQLIIQVGYPDEWPDYSDLKLKPNFFVGNFRQIHQFLFEKDLSRIGKTKGAHQWKMTPQKSNAYYCPWNNEIIIPAGILHFPFYDPSNDLPSNYGSIGVVIGHELAHLFDNEGRLFDSSGNLRNWWSQKDERSFEKHFAKLIPQYSSYKIKKTKINGVLTHSENIADLGGLTIAYEALMSQISFLEKKTRRQEVRKFFIAFARIFRTRITNQRTLYDLITNCRAPRKYRVNGTLSNFLPFYQAFNIKKGDKMYLPKSQRTCFW